MTTPLRGKHRRFLRALGVNETPVLHVGKEGLTQPVIDQAANALKARELIKGRVLETAPDDPEGTARELADATGAELVQVIGRNFLLFKRNRKEPRIQLPD